MREFPLTLFALGASRAFGEAVARSLGTSLSAQEERVFEDGEHKTRPLESVRGHDVYVVHSLHGDAEQSVNDKLVRLLLFVGALKDASAARVTVVAPYLAYSRKDRKSKPRDPVATRYVAQLLESVGTDCVVTLDVHNLAAYQNAFRCRTEHLEANPLFARRFAAMLGDAPVAVVSPDEGGIKRAEDLRRRLADALGRPVNGAFVEKYRSGGEVSGGMLAGEVRGHVAIIVDDLISAGTTVARAARACREHGATAVHAAASHGVLAPEANAALATADIDSVVVTDTIPPRHVAEGPLKAKLALEPVAPLFGEAIRCLHEGGSIVALSGS